YQDDRAFHAPATGLLAALGNTRVIAFVAVWFGINILFGTGLVSIPGAEGGIAWEAHVGGFLVGLIGFSLFDLRPPQNRYDDNPGGDLE
ncbi:MAG: rhomboid family intramembrane serine protease, partial [Fimbriimonadaceae bacterium]|nr:rhomboid family intramembrane serine protease [Alphaproteobacteria bacterium]